MALFFYFIIIIDFYFEMSNYQYRYFDIPNITISSDYILFLK